METMTTEMTRMVMMMLDTVANMLEGLGTWCYDHPSSHILVHILSQHCHWHGTAVVCPAFREMVWRG